MKYIVECPTTAIGMFLQWCRDGLIKNFIFVQRLVSWELYRNAKGQDVASVKHHCRNTNVAGKFKTPLQRHALAPVCHRQGH
jgi:hypothetical protein